MPTIWSAEESYDPMDGAPGGILGGGSNSELAFGSELIGIVKG